MPRVTLTALLDLLLTLGLTLRLTRLIITDDLGKWWLRDPLDSWMHGHPPEVFVHRAADGTPVYAGTVHTGDVLTQRAADAGKRWAVWGRGGGRMRWHRYLAGLTCPFCVGFWIAGAALASLALVGGPGDAAELWRWIAGWFTLNWISAHLGSRLGDAGYAEETE